MKTILKLLVPVIGLYMIVGFVRNEFSNSHDPRSMASAELAGMNFTKLKEASKYAGGSGCIMRGGKIVFSWGDLNKRYSLKSTTKS